MLGLKIFLHAVRMVLGNLGAAIRISLPILAVWPAASAYEFIKFGSIAGLNEWAAGIEASGSLAAPAGFWPVIIVFMVFGIIAFLWTATAWHRFILLEEYPGAMGARFNAGAVGRYFAAGLLVTFIVILIAIALGFIAGFLGAILTRAGVNRTLVVAIITIVLYVPLLIIAYRLSLILPSSALGPRIAIGEAWSATANASGTVLILAIVSVAVSALLNWLTAMLLVAAPVAGFVLQLIVQWGLVMVGVSILTTIYGLFIQKRSLNA